MRFKAEEMAVWNLENKYMNSVWLELYKQDIEKRSVIPNSDDVFQNSR